MVLKVGREAQSHLHTWQTPSSTHRAILITGLGKNEYAGAHCPLTWTKSIIKPAGNDPGNMHKHATW